MPSFILDSCCFCIELRTGCLIIGYLNLIAELIFIILGAMGLSAGSAVMNSGDHDLQQIGTVFVAISAVLLVVMLFFFTFTVILLVGVHQNKRGHVKAYLIVSLICLIISAITTLCGLGGYYDTREFAGRIVAYIVSIYFLLVVRSHYYEMEEKPAPAYNNA